MTDVAVSLEMELPCGGNEQTEAYAWERDNQTPDDYEFTVQHDATLTYRRRIGEQATPLELQQCYIGVEIDDRTYPVTRQVNGDIVGVDPVPMHLGDETLTYRVMLEGLPYTTPGLLGRFEFAMTGNVPNVVDDELIHYEA